MKQCIIILSTLAFFFNANSQSRWVQQYLDELSAAGHNMSPGYDDGYLLTGRIVPGYQFTWLIKTDMNGEILWQKKIRGYYDRIIIDYFKQNEEGEIFLCGGVVQDGNTDPLVMKLDACGEKIWCRTLMTTSNYDFYTDIIVTTDGGCATLVIQTFHPLFINRKGLLRFSTNGDLLWQHYYQSQDPGIQDDNLYNLLLTPDKGFLMTGYCYYPDPDNPGLSWLHPYYVKTDSLGNFEWEVVLHSETADIGGMANQTILSNSETCYYSCIDHYYHSDTLYAKRPAIVKMDLQGNVLGVYDLVHNDYDWGGMWSIAFINDSLLAGGAAWFYSENEPQSRAVVFDTLGNIRDSLTLLNTGWLAKTAVTHDGKLLFYNTIEEDDGFDTYLFKLTQDLEQDTYYTRPFVYDSLCPYQIASDTIVPDDCGVIVGIEENGGGKARGHGGMEIFPNPASGEIHVRLNMDVGRFNKDLTLDIYDIFGRTAAPTPALPHSGEGVRWVVNVMELPPGIYFAVVREGTTVVARGKFVVAR